MINNELKYHFNYLYNGYSNSYLFINNNTLYIIDPSFNIKDLDILIKKEYKDLNNINIFITHGHYDHFCSLNDVIKYCINNKYSYTIYINKLDYLKLENKETSCSMYFNNIDYKLRNKDHFVFISDNQIFNIDGLTIKVLHTPGHTNGSICLLINNSILFSGDTLFYHSIGRCDLPSGNNIMMTESIKRLMKLDPNIIVYPGHDESTTIGEEIKNNPYYIRSK